MECTQSCRFVGNGRNPIAVGPWGGQGGTQWDDDMYTKSYRFEGNGRNPIAVGPWGGQGGTQWDDGTYTKECMQSCRFVGNGRNPIAVGPWGGQGGTQWDDGMYTKVSVGKGYDRVLAVRGKEDKKCFSKKSSISSSYSDSSDDYDTLVAGSMVAVRGKQDSSSSFSDFSSSSSDSNSSSSDSSDHDEEYQYKVPYKVVKKPFLSGEGIVKAIQIEYDRNGQSVWSAKHGGNSGDVTHRVPYRVVKERIPSGPGPWGGDGGRPWDDGVYSGIRQTLVTTGRVTAIRKEYDRNGQSVRDVTHTVPYRVVKELVPSGPGPWGGDGGRPWDDGLYSGIRQTLVTTGRVTAIRKEYDRNGQSVRDVAHTVPYRVVKEPVPSGPGPWGGDGCRPWDDGVYSGVRQILVTTGRVTAIRKEYDRNEQSVRDVTHTIRFEYPNEVLNCITGYYGCIKDYEGHKVIKSLTFYTTRGKYGPYGKEIGTFFTSGTTQGKVVGFHGRSGSYLDAIGVHMQHWLGERRQPSYPSQSSLVDI